ncbi:terpenoid synthase, partial [Trametes elegans]
IRDFIERCGFQSPHSAVDSELRCHISDEVASWNVGLTAAHAEKVVDTSCLLTETAYAHTSPEHRYFVARYTAYFLYADDLGGRCVEALNQFPRLFAIAQAQLDPVLDRLAELIRGAHALWTDVGANAIITGTLDALTAYHIELTTRDMVVRPGAVRYPDYLRLRTGIDPPFIAFVFMRGWRATAQSYLQFVPDMEWWIGAANLSFYKEELENETTNYVHVRAAVEQSSRLQVLQKLANEVLETQRRLDSMMADDEELAALWRGYVQGYLEFSIKTPRYRLAELGFTA